MRSSTPPALFAAKTVHSPEPIEKELRRGKLPLFGFSVLLYGLGLLISAWLANGNAGRVFWLVVSFLLFWLVIAIGRKTTYLYNLGLGLSTFMVLVGWLCLANLDDDNLRNNWISDKILQINLLVSPRLPGLQMHRNTLAGMLAVMGVLSLSYGLFSRQGWMRWLGRVNGLLMLGLLLITNSRGGLVAFMAGGALLVALGWAAGGEKRYRNRQNLTLSLALVVLAGWYLVASGQYQLFTPERLLDENGISRLEIWGNTLYMLGDVPLTGFGPGNFKAVYPFYIDPSAVSGRSSQEHTHNIFLQIYGEAGLAGFLGIAGVFGRLTGLVVSALRKRQLFAASPGPPSPEQTERATLLGRGGLAASGATFIYGLTEFNPWNEQFTFLFWFPLALVAGVYARQGPPKARLGFRAARLFHRVKGWPAGLALISGLVIISGLAAWQIFGLILVNMAGLASEQNWTGARNIEVNTIVAQYQAAEASVGWTGLPRRGEAWAAWQQNDTGRAEQLLRQVIAGNPGDRRSLLMLGDLLAASPLTGAAALTYWRQAQAAPLFVDRGRRILDSDNDLGAESYFLKAIEIDPQSWDGYRFLVMLYQRHGRTQDAVALLEKARPYFKDDSRIQDELNTLQPAS